jgi:hypothetical protein
MSIAYRGTLTGTVTMESFLQLVNPFVFLANEPRVVITGRDAFALSTAWYGQSPSLNEGATGTTDSVFGIQIPLWVKVGPKELYSYNATRVAVANVASEVFHAGLFALDKPPDLSYNSPSGNWGLKAPNGPGRLDIRQILATLPAATGYSQILPTIPRIGLLRGLLIFNTTVPTSAAVTGSVQRLQLQLPSSNPVDIHWNDMQSTFRKAIDFTRADATAMTTRQILQNYGWVELRDTPIDLVANNVAINVDVQLASDPIRIIPVIEIPQPA